MKKIRLIPLVFSFFLVFSLFTTVAFTQSTVNVTLLNSKGEIQAQLEEMAAYYNRVTKGVKVEIIACPVGQSPFERTMALYSAGNAPTIAMLDPADVIRFQDKALDLKDEKWVQDAIDRSLDRITLPNGKLLGFPFAVEGYGLIYNRQVVEQATNGKFDPATIRTTADLEALFKKIEATGNNAIVISPLDWSLGHHFLAIFYATQSADSAAVDEFLAKLRAGKVDLAANKQFNGLLDTFDVMKKYNVDQGDPLSGTYDRGSELLGLGEVGFWFMGNWAWPNIKDFDTADGQYGFLPVPISNNPRDYGNSQIPVGVTKYFIVDGEQSTKAQQKAAKDFLNWLVYDPKGQEYVVSHANVIPAFKNIKVEPNDPLARSLLEYVAQGDTLEFITQLPADHWAVLGASMQKYLAGVIDRKGLATEIEQYWKNLK
ncbi:MAG: carbohydrate ABC transporter substrate-binding protein [Firmicutes bacterium]|nr:carbohydrate ABC transporter substrate-binding protein [Bacillota bacterium]